MQSSAWKLGNTNPSLLPSHTDPEQAVYAALPVFWCLKACTDLRLGQYQGSGIKFLIPEIKKAILPNGEKNPLGHLQRVKRNSV